MAWVTLAVLSAIFAAATTILAKIGIKGIDSNVATAIRTVVILLLAWGIVIGQGHLKNLASIPKVSWIFLILSGVTTGLSWLCYFKALQIGKAAPVAAIDKMSMIFTLLLAITFLGENTSKWGMVGIALMATGARMIAYWG